MQRIPRGSVQLTDAEARTREAQASGDGDGGGWILEQRRGCWSTVAAYPQL